MIAQNCHTLNLDGVPWVTGGPLRSTEASSDRDEAVSGIGEITFKFSAARPLARMYLEPDQVMDALSFLGGALAATRFLAR